MLHQSWPQLCTVTTLGSSCILAAEHESHCQSLNQPSNCCTRLWNIQSWPKISAPLVNMIKEGCENESALLILLIYYLKKNHTNLTLHWIIRIYDGVKYHL